MCQEIPLVQIPLVASSNFVKQYQTYTVLASSLDHILLVWTTLIFMYCLPYKSGQLQKNCILFMPLFLLKMKVLWKGPFNGVIDQLFRLSISVSGRLQIYQFKDKLIDLQVQC